LGEEMNSLMVATNGLWLAMPVDEMKKQSSCPAGGTLRRKFFSWAFTEAYDKAIGRVKA
jgi:hypothetical protein